jgi:hypothetical protein
MPSYLLFWVEEYGGLPSSGLHLCLPGQDWTGLWGWSLRGPSSFLASRNAYSVCQVPNTSLMVVVRVTVGRELGTAAPGHKAELPAPLVSHSLCDLLSLLAPHLLQCLPWSLCMAPQPPPNPTPAGLLVLKLCILWFVESGSSPNPAFVQALGTCSALTGLFSPF